MTRIFEALNLESIIVTVEGLACGGTKKVVVPAPVHASLALLFSLNVRVPAYGTFQSSHLQ